MQSYPKVIFHSIQKSSFVFRLNFENKEQVLDPSKVTKNKNTHGVTSDIDI